MLCTLYPLWICSSFSIENELWYMLALLTYDLPLYEFTLSSFFVLSQFVFKFLSISFIRSTITAATWTLNIIPGCIICYYRFQGINVCLQLYVLPGTRIFIFTLLHVEVRFQVSRTILLLTSSSDNKRFLICIAKLSII